MQQCHIINDRANEFHFIIFIIIIIITVSIILFYFEPSRPFFSNIFDHYYYYIKQFVILACYLVIVNCPLNIAFAHYLQFAL